MRGNQVVEDGRHLGQKFAGALQRRDGVVEVGRRGIVGNRGDLGGMVDKRLLEGRQEVLRADLVEWRRREGRHPGLQKRVRLGRHCIRILVGF